MNNPLKWTLIVLASIGLLVVVFIWIYATLRAKRLEEKYAQFRTVQQAAHDAIDAQFHQKDVVVNGLKWHYVDEGNPDGTVILFLHGLPEGWYSWRYVLPLVDQNYRLIAIDMKGYGRSDRTDTDYNWHTVASQTLDLMTRLGIDKFYMVSHDWGSIIGSVLVSDHPERILGYMRMEADLIQRKNTGMISAYLQKPQWLLFQSKFIGSYMMGDPGWFIDMVYTKRMVTPFNQQDRDYLVYEFSRPGVSDVVPDLLSAKELGPGYCHR